MKTWKRLALASAIGAAVAMPAFAADGDALQSQEKERGGGVERNPVLTAPGSATTPVPFWGSRHDARMTNDRLMSQPDPIEHREATMPADIAPSTTSAPADRSAPAMVPSYGTASGVPSASQESRATGKVDAPDATPPQTGSDVQAGDMGPASPKAGGNQ